MKIIPVSEKLQRSPWGFVNKGGFRPEIDLNDGERRLFRHLICVTSGVGDWTVDIVTVIYVKTPR